MQEINKQAKRNGRIIDYLLQFHIAEEESKYGLSLINFNELIKNKEFEELKNVNIKGVMGMATLTDNESLVRKELNLWKRLVKL